MRTRGVRAGGPRPTVPEWLTEFTLTDWYDADEPVPLAEQVDMGTDVWRSLQAYLRWESAGRDWLTASGYDGSPRGWRRVVGPEHWGCDPHRLAKEVHR